MTLQLGPGVYGLEIRKVREIVGLPAITSVPRAPAFLAGVINLRGRVLPVVDLRLKFGMSATEATDQTVVIVVEVSAAGRTLTMGVLVDQVLEVFNFDAASIEPPPDLGEVRIDGDFILGIGKAAQRIVFLLDIGRIFSGADASALLQAAQA